MKRIFSSAIVFMFLSGNVWAQSAVPGDPSSLNDAYCSSALKQGLDHMTASQKKEFDEKCIGWRVPGSIKGVAPGAGAATEAAVGGGFSTANIVSILAAATLGAVALTSNSKAPTGTR